MDVIILYAVRVTCGLVRFFESSTNKICTIATAAVGASVFLSVLLYLVFVRAAAVARTDSTDSPLEPSIIVDRSGQACPINQDNKQTVGKFMVRLRKKSGTDEEEMLCDKEFEDFDKLKRSTNYNDVIRLTVVNGPEYWQGSSTSTYQNLSDIRGTYV